MRARSSGGSVSSGGLPVYEAYFFIDNNHTPPTFRTETTTDAAIFPGYFGGGRDFNGGAAGTYLLSAFAEWQEAAGSPPAATTMSVQITPAGSFDNILVLGPMFDGVTVDWTGSGAHFWHPQSVTMVTASAGGWGASFRAFSTDASVQSGFMVVTALQLNPTMLPGFLAG